MAWDHPRLPARRLCGGGRRRGQPRPGRTLRWDLVALGEPMSGMFGKGSTSSGIEKLATIQISTSCYGHAKPIVYGTTRIAANMIDYDDFTSKKVKSGGKGGGSTTGYTYSAGIILALCEG